MQLVLNEPLNILNLQSNKQKFL